MEEKAGAKRNVGKGKHETRVGETLPEPLGAENHAALHAMHCVTDGATASLDSSEQLSVVSCRFSVGDAIALPAGSSSDEEG